MLRTLVQFVRDVTYGLGAVISSGATLALIPRVDSGRALEMFAAERVTVFESAPAMYGALLGVVAGGDLDFGSLRLCISMGAVMSTGVLRRFEDEFDCMVLEGYGLPETSGGGVFESSARDTQTRFDRHTRRRRADAGG